jgi:hypothetical protein
LPHFEAIGKPSETLLALRFLSGAWPHWESCTRGRLVVPGRRAFFVNVAQLVEEVEMFQAVRRLARPGEDRRSEDRNATILRVGVLSQGGKACFCLVRNVSPAGLQVKLYGSNVRVGAVCIRVADEDPLSARIVWIRKACAGLEFDTSIDPETLLRLQQKLRPLRRRSQPRIKASSYAAVQVDGRNIQAVLLDISSMGARMTTSRPLEVGAHVSVRFPDLPEIRAHVRWTEGSDCGLVFEAPVPIEVIAQWIDGRLRVGG